MPLRLARSLLVAALFFAALLLVSLPGPARAGGAIWQPEALVHDMFPTSTQVVPTGLDLSAQEQAAGEASTGMRLRAPSWTAWTASTNGKIDGYVIFDHQQGQHEPIDFAVQLSPEGVILRHEVVAYRESYGQGIELPAFRQQFVGKTAADPMVLGRQIKNISGATYSSRAMVIGVQRDAALGQVLVSRQQAQLANMRP